MKHMIVLTATAVIGLLQVAPAHAFNDWYRQGYADGAVNSESACTSRNQNMIYTLSAENEQLRQQLALLQQNAVLNGTYNNVQTAQNTTPQNFIRDNDDDDAQTYKAIVGTK